MENNQVIGVGGNEGDGHPKTQTQLKIDLVCRNLANFLKEKNIRYGDAALNPVKIFSKNTTTCSSLVARIDDKLNRIINAPLFKKNDVVDLAGYLVLLMIDQEWLDFTEFLD